MLVQEQPALIPLVRKGSDLALTNRRDVRSDQTKMRCNTSVSNTSVSLNIYEHQKQIWTGIKIPSGNHEVVYFGRVFAIQVSTRSLGSLAVVIVLRIKCGHFARLCPSAGLQQVAASCQGRGGQSRGHSPQFQQPRIGLEYTTVYVRCDCGYDGYHETHQIVTVYSEFVPSRLGRQNEDKAARALRLASAMRSTMLHWASLQYNTTHNLASIDHSAAPLLSPPLSAAPPPKCRRPAAAYVDRTCSDQLDEEFPSVPKSISFLVQADWRKIESGRGPDWRIYRRLP
ncbi:hypothetical protein F511_40854 [Dorcoceras hygrometricum]|uniref:Uncharacterized protein n=1 Tax=Dorcoceras hygrometricum TaxID=472368 RepID=A0A2Z7AFS7_9LAMI|nr:hypothetical protein F511_40854 [Dorcoceras hygrometricum]